MTYNDLFEATTPDNPLRRLSERDKITLFANAVLFSRIRREPSSDWHPLEGMQAEIRDSAALAQLIELEVLQSFLLDGIEELKLMAMDLPQRLKQLNEALHKLVRTGYKQGHEAQNFETEVIVSMSGLLLARTGKFNDPALAELLQPMFPVNQDFSEASIARRRTRLRSEYPERYEVVISRFANADTGA